MYDVLPSLDLSGKKVAVFCTGDQKGYEEVRFDVYLASMFISTTVPNHSLRSP